MFVKRTIMLSNFMLVCALNSAHLSGLLFARAALLPKDWLILIIFAGLWLYIIIPLVIDLSSQLKVVF